MPPARRRHRPARGDRRVTQTGKTPRNGLAKLLWDAEPDSSAEEIASQKQLYECPSCGWEAQLRRNQCMLCEWDEPLEAGGE